MEMCWEAGVKGWEMKQPQRAGLESHWAREGLWIYYELHTKPLEESQHSRDAI